MKGTDKTNLETTNLFNVGIPAMSIFDSAVTFKTLTCKKLMCGLSGIISSNIQDMSYILEMNNLIEHRGPDGEGIAYYQNGDFKILKGNKLTERELKDFTHNYGISNIALGHRRLAIIDTTEAGNQPMNDNYSTIIFNGEIYNYKDLKQDLEKEGIYFQGNTDTEVILKIYDKYGIHGLNKLEGMWAFILVNNYTREIIICRDRYGIKPLYYWHDNKNNLYIGSEIKQFTKHPDWKSKLNHQRAYDYIVYSMTDHTEETMFKDVYILPPGHYIKVNFNEKGIVKELIQWYNRPSQKFKSNFEDAKDEFFHLFSNAIAKHLVSDVDVCFTLSGGLDSTSIVGIAKKMGLQNLKCFSAISEYQSHSEEFWIKKTQDILQLDINWVIADPCTAIEKTDELLWYMDEPYQSQSALLGYQLFKAANEAGYKVILGGQGADEYLSGYGDFKHLRNIELLNNLKIKKLLDSIESKNSLDIILNFYELMMNRLIRKSKYVRNNRMQKNFFKPIENCMNFNCLKAEKKFPDLPLKTNLENTINTLLIKDPLPKFLRWEDRNSMANSIEARVPFLDHKLVEFTQSLPVEYLDEPYKRKKILVESVKNIIPEEVRIRGVKVGFMTPEEPWIKGNQKNEFESLIEESVKQSKHIFDMNAAKEYYEMVTSSKISFSNAYLRIILFGKWMRKFNIDL